MSILTKQTKQKDGKSNNVVSRQ